MQFSYNSKNQLLYTINSANFSALCYFYTKDTLPKVSRIDSGAVRKFFKTENKAPEVYVGEDVYFGEGGFITAACEKILELTTYSDNSMKYKIKTDDEIITFKTTNENVLSSKVGSTMYYKNEETEPVGYEDFSYTYTYDNLDRFSKKCSKETIFNKGKNNEAAIAVEQEIIYKEGTEVPVGIIYSVDSKIKNKTEDSASFSFVNGYDRYGNIISMLESGVRYETSPQTTATQNKVRMESRTNVYSYDSFNRLTKEENFYFGGIDYQYGNISGMIEKVIKTNGDQKTFSYEKGRLTNVKINDIMHLVGYDHYGNVTKTDKATITYNARNLMDSCSVQNTNVQYNYNYQGTRSRKQITQSGTTTYVNYYLDGNTTLGEDWTDSKGNITRKIRYFYDAQGICGLRYDGDNYTYIKDSIGNISKIMHNGKIIGEYIYDAWGNHEVVGISIENDKEEFVLYNNPFRYKEYYYDIETQLYWVSSRYYSPELCRWISPDSIEYLDPQSINGLNLYAYCGNDPVNHIDPSGHAWYHWAIGAGIIVLCAALTVVTAGGFAAAGTAFASVVSATMAPTALSAVFAGATIGAAAIGTAGMVIGGMSGEDGWSWENASQGFMAGSIAGAVIGGAWGGAHYALQSAGKMAIRTNINNLVNNPLDEFVTVGPKDGGISGYVRSISQTGDYGQIFASKLPNGMYQIANGHHRVAALRQLGYKYVNFFLVP